MLISKSDLKTYVQFSDNIEDRLIDFHIKLVQETIIEPLLDPIMFANLEQVVSNPSNSYPELATLFEDYIKAWICNKTIYSFYSQHGINVTQYGIRVMNEDTSQPVAPEDRAMLLQTVKNNANAYWLRLDKRMADDNYTYDNITYNDENCKKDKGINLGIKRVSRVGKRFNPFNDNSEIYKHL
jgi:hypothetical protein